MERAVDTFAESRKYTRRHARTFYFASHLLPREKRYSAYAVYAFCRYVDDVADAAAEGSDRGDLALALTGLHQEVDELYEGRGRVGRWGAFRETVIDYGIPKEYFHTLIHGVEMDLEKNRYATFAELEEYCYRVASVVGLIMTRIFGASSEKALLPAADLGTAMQLTNILRDVGEDLRMGRLYIPREDLHRFGVTDADLLAGKVTDRFVDLMRFEIDRSREFYRRGKEGLRYLTNDGSRYCATLMGEAYAGILDAIEENGYDVFTRRAHVPLRRKLLLALRGAILPDSTPPVRADSPGERSDPAQMPVRTASAGG